MAADKRQPRSLAARVLVIASAWAVIALFVIGILILTLYRNGTERGFRDLLRAQLYNVINSVSLDENGRLEGTPQLGDLRFSQPGSGWYWIVDIVGDNPPDKLASVSLGDRTLAIPSTDVAPFNERYERIYAAQASTGLEVMNFSKPGKKGFSACSV